MNDIDITECANDSDKLKIRIHNLGSTDFELVELISSDNKVNFESVNSKDHSCYKRFDHFNIKDWQVIVHFSKNKQAIVNTVHVGQYDLTEGQFRISIIAESGQDNPDTIYLISE